MSYRTRVSVACCLLLVAGIPSATAGADPSTSRGEPAAAPRVLAISIDALNPTALTRLGRDELPNFWRLIDEGSATLNARSQVELTLTLPNHTSMLTGRRINAKKGRPRRQLER